MAASAPPDPIADPHRTADIGSRPESAATGAIDGCPARAGPPTAAGHFMAHVPPEHRAWRVDRPEPDHRPRYRTGPQRPPTTVPGERMGPDNPRTHVRRVHGPGHWASS